MTQVNKISDFKLERYLLGELPESEMVALQKREAEDEIFAARVAEMRLQGKRLWLKIRLPLLKNASRLPVAWKTASLKLPAIPCG